MPCVLGFFLQIDTNTQQLFKMEQCGKIQNLEKTVFNILKKTAKQKMFLLANALIRPHNKTQS